MAEAYALCIDLGGTFIKGALVDNAGAIQKQTKYPTHAGDGTAAVLDAIFEVISELSADTPAVAGIGIGAPGHADTKSGLISSLPNLNDLNGVNLREKIQEKFDFPVYIDNDATNAAAGEFYFGAGRGFTNLICITVGTGIGAGLVFNGSVYRGISDYAGEFGHMTIIPAGRECACGNFGCIEAYASGTAITTSARLGRDRHSGSMLVEHKPESISPLLVKQLADKGDAFCIEIYRQAGSLLGTALASVVNLLNLELCIVGGGVSAAGDILFEPMRAAFGASVMIQSAKKCKILPAQLGNDAGVLGCAALVFMQKDD